MPNILGALCFLTLIGWAVPLKAATPVDLLSLRLTLRSDLVELDINENGNLFVGGIDQIFSDLSGKKFLLLKLVPLKPLDDVPPFSFRNNDSKSSFGSIVVKKYSSSTAISALFVGFSDSEIARLTGKIFSKKPGKTHNEEASRDRLVPIFSLFLPASYADNNCNPCVFRMGPIAAASSLSLKLRETFEASQTLQWATTCAQTAASQALEQTSGLIYEARDFVLHPFDVWQKVSQSFQEFKDFIFNLNAELTNGISWIKSLSFEIRGQLLCQIVGALTPQILLSLASGVALKLLLAKVALIITRLKTFASYLQFIDKLKQGKKNISHLIARLMDDRLPESFTHFLESLAKKSPDTLNQVLQCLPAS